MKPSLPEFKAGRRFAGPLPPGADLITSIEGLCQEGSIRMAAFRVWGAVSSFTIGTYDQAQQVFVTHFQAAPREIVSCAGTVCLQDGLPQVNAQIALSDEGGNLTGGHLFSETLIFTGEIDLQELLGAPLKRTYDRISGRLIWRASD